MGRSVSYANNSLAIAYREFDGDCDSFQWEVVEDTQEYGKSLWPSMSNCDKWIGSEDHAILENRHAYIGVSAYCGVVSIWLVPKEDNNLARQWCESIKGKFLKSFGTLNKVGSFSNGEAVFERANHG